MISILVSTYREKLFKTLCLNIKQTIGAVDYEILKIHNEGTYSITKVYNDLAKTAQYDLLLFLHEDVSFITNEWGVLLLKAYKNTALGVVGLAGCSKRFKLPTGVDLGIKAYRSITVLHDNDEQSKRVEAPFAVKSVDGVFMAVPKDVWEHVKFDETIKGFHGYDLDFSLRVSKTYQNIVLPSIQLLHFSKGNFGTEWVNSILKLYTNPSYCFDIPTKDELNFVRRYWYSRLSDEAISFSTKLRYLFAMGVSVSSFKKAIVFLFKTKSR